MGNSLGWWVLQLSGGQCYVSLKKPLDLIPGYSFSIRLALFTAPLPLPSFSPSDYFRLPDLTDRSSFEFTARGARESPNSRRACKGPQPIGKRHQLETEKRQTAFRRGPDIDIASRKTVAHVQLVQLARRRHAPLHLRLRELLSSGLNIEYSWNEPLGAHQSEADGIGRDLHPRPYSHLRSVGTLISALGRLGGEGGHNRHGGQRKGGRHRAVVALREAHLLAVVPQLEPHRRQAVSLLRHYHVTIRLLVCDMLMVALCEAHLLAVVPQLEQHRRHVTIMLHSNGRSSPGDLKPYTVDAKPARGARAVRAPGAGRHLCVAPGRTRRALASSLPPGGSRGPQRSSACRSGTYTSAGTTAPPPENP
eukprot:7213071-Pyramimonas_sp.AAC.1